MLMKKMIFLLIVPFLFQCQSKELVATDYSSAIDSANYALQKVLDDSSIPGMGAAVMVNGELVYSKGLGYSDIQNQIPVDPSTTLFRIGSVSKSVTSLALGRLFQEGKLDFESEVQEYVPEFPIKKYPITVEQVAGHIAGIRHYRGNEMMNDQYYATVTEGLDIFSEDSLLFEPSTDYSYSSYGWNLLSAVVEGASGDKFLNYMQTEVFEPLGLSNIKADIAPDDIPGRTKFYFLSSGDSVAEAPYVDNSYKWAGGGFIATPVDMVRFGHFMLEPTIISAATVQRLIKPQMINDTTSTNYGIGWVSRETEKGVKWFGHSGGSVGGITQLIIYPESKIVVGLTTNSSDVDYQNVHHRIAQWFIDANE